MICYSLNTPRGGSYPCTSTRTTRSNQGAWPTPLSQTYRSVGLSAGFRTRQYHSTTTTTTTTRLLDVHGTCASCLPPNTVFDMVTVGVMPLYALMMWFPRAPLTRALMGSNMFLFLGGSVLYAYMLVSYGGYEIFKPLVESFKVHGVSAECSSRYLAIMADMLRDSKITAITWVHLLLMDLFQAKWVYHDALRHNVSSIHSLVLCFMVGPLGLLSHILTKTLKQTRVH